MSIWTGKKLPKVILAKVSNWYIASFDKPKDFLWYKSNFLKIHLIVSILELEEKEYWLEDILSIAKDKTETFKKDIYEYITKFNNTKYFTNKVSWELSTINQNNKYNVVDEEWNRINYAFEFIENLSKYVWFNFSKDSSDSISLNMKSFTLFLNKNNFDKIFIEYIESIPKYKDYMVDLDNQQLRIIYFLFEFIYPYFYDWSTHKNITIFLSWLKDFSLRFHIMSNSLKLVTFYIQEVEKRKTNTKWEVWSLYYSYEKQLEQILNYTNWSLDNAKFIISTLEKQYNKKWLSFTLKTIVKDMYSVKIENNIENKTINLIEYPNEFVLKMKELNIEENMYNEYYKIYISEWINWIS